MTCVVYGIIGCLCAAVLAVQSSANFTVSDEKKREFNLSTFYVSAYFRFCSKASLY
jgi:hypothetical protein